jgi:aminopeptidase N
MLLEVSFEPKQGLVKGNVTHTFTPLLKTVDSIVFDAINMRFSDVKIDGKTARFKSDPQYITIYAASPLSWQTTHTVQLVYECNPKKGIYFVGWNDSTNRSRKQIWTQGEEYDNRNWIPGYDDPSDKLITEIVVTMPAAYQVLSNGTKLPEKKDKNGNKIWHYNMTHPHVFYLTMLGIGEYAVKSTKAKSGVPLNAWYYPEQPEKLEPTYRYTDHIMNFFEQETGVPYPWESYSQIPVQEFMYGAMENTTATLHSDVVQQDARELTDGNRWEETIAHELFHQWFGDYVTTESWSNITLNESFATLGSQLWNEFHYGKDFGDEERYNSAQGYIQSHSENKTLVRFYYNDKEDVFDAVSYNKGGAILQMLRAFVGDSAFFKALNLYLTANKFKSAEAQQLRLAFEEVTGKDLNWFWNEWYYGSGHPKLNITYSYDNNAKQARVIVQQTTDKTFLLPVKIDVWNGNAATTHSVWVKNKVDTFSFSSSTRPSLINFDADKKLLAEKTENKSLEEYLFQYRNAKNYFDRREAIDAAIKKQAEKTAMDILMAAMKDKFGPLRAYATSAIDLTAEQIKTAAEPLLFGMAQNETDRIAKAAAIAKLGNYKLQKYASLFRSATNDSSYTVAGNALEALSKIDSAGASNEAKRLSSEPAKGKLARMIHKLAAPVNGENLLADFEAMPLGQAKFDQLNDIFDFMDNTSSLPLFQRAVDAILKLENDIPEGYREQISEQLNNALRQLQTEKAAAGMKEQADYIDSKLPKPKNF